MKLMGPVSNVGVPGAHSTERSRWLGDGYSNIASQDRLAVATALTSLCETEARCLS